MKKILFIAGDFWPTATGGTIRVEKLMKYLPELGWECMILTRRLDGMKASDQKGSVSIYRTNAFDLGVAFQKVKKIFARKKNDGAKPAKTIAGGSGNNRLANYFFVPDIDIFWALGSLFKIFKITKESSAEIVYSTSPCASVHIIALVLKLFKGRSVKWIAEFRDPWTFNPFRSPKPYLLEVLDHKLEKAVIKNCDKIVVTSEEYKIQFLDKYPSCNPDKISYIPNGFDSDDFTDLEKNTLNTDKKIRVIHTGNFYGKRSIKPFLEALSLIKDEYPESCNLIEVIQYGVLDPEGALYNEQHPNPIFECRNIIPHKSSLQETMLADWLLLVPGPGIGTMPGKFYEYLATGNPILALVDEGPVIKLIQKLNIGYVLPTDDIHQIKLALLDILRGNPRYQKMDPNDPAINRFDRKNIAMQVSEMLKN